MKKSRIAGFFASALFLVAFLQIAQLEAAELGKKILASSFPVYQILRNIIKDSGSEAELLLPAQLGCPHDYALAPQDMAKLAKAETLVANGLGLEEFLGAPLRKANPNIILIDASAGIKELIRYTETCEHDHGDDHAERHHHETVNPHIFASPRMAAKMAAAIGDGLAKADPANSGKYLKNAREYSERLNKLADEMIECVRKFKNKKFVQPHGVFDYLARDIGLEIIATMQAHGQEPSAAEILELIKIIRNERPGVIASEPQYSDKIADMLSRETGVPRVHLDPVASGPEDAPLDYYEKKMTENIKTLEKILGY